MKKDPDAIDHPDEDPIIDDYEENDDGTHKDFEPIIDFPGTEPDYKEKPRQGSDTLEEEAHWSLHNIVNAIVHKEIQTNRIIDEMQEIAKNGSNGGSLLKPHAPMKPYVKQEDRKKKQG